MARKTILGFLCLNNVFSTESSHIQGIITPRVIGRLSWFQFIPFSLPYISTCFTHTGTSPYSTISEKMRLATDPADFLATPYRFLFNSTLVNDTLNYLTPGNSVVFIGTQKLNFNGSSHSTVTQDSPENVPWPVLTQVCAVHSFEDK